MKRVFMLLLSAALVTPTAAMAAPSYRLFNFADGLPGTSILCLAQDANGSIWAGTDQGAARYENYRWSRVWPKDAGPPEAVTAIDAASDGRMWLVTARGLLIFDGVDWTRIGVPEPLAAGGLSAAARGDDGVIWLGGPGGLVRFDAATGVPELADGAPAGEIKALYIDARNRLWVAADKGIGMLDGGRWREVGDKSDLPPGIRRFFQDSRGTIFLAGSKGLMTLIEGGLLLKLDKSAVEGLSPPVLDVTEDRQGRLWIGTAAGAAWNDGYRWRPLPGMESWPGRRVSAVLAGNSGEIWLGTDAGVLFIRRVWDAAGGEENADLRHPALIDPDGGLWAAASEGLAHLDGADREDWKSRQGIEGTVTALLKEESGDLWIGTTAGLHRLSGRRLTIYRAPKVEIRPVQIREDQWTSEKVRRLTTAEGLTGDRVTALHRDGRGWLWVGTDSGLSALERDRWRLFDDRPPSRGGITALTGMETVWIGTDSGLFAFNGREWRNGASSGGPDGIPITALLEDGEDLWVGTTEGLWRLSKDGWSRPISKDDFPATAILSLAKDSRGRLWVGTPTAVILHRGGAWSSVGLADGLPVQGAGSLAWDQASERLLIAGPGGLTWFSPEKRPPRSFVKNPPGGVVGAAHCLFEFSGADLETDASKLRFSWRLDNGSWSPLSRGTVVMLSDLSNGGHTFEVRAVDALLNVDPTPAAAFFEVNTALFDIEVKAFEVKDLFAALYRFYAGDFPPGASPVGRLALRNTYDRPLKVKVGLLIGEFMEFATDRVVDIPPGKEIEVGLRLEMNDSVLSLRETASVQLQLIIQYHRQGELKENRLSRGIVVHGRNTMSWDDPRQIGLYVNHLDPYIDGLAKEVVRNCRRFEDEYAVDNNVIRAAALFDFLGRRGLRYLPDPLNPYAGLANRAGSLDTVRFPRETAAAMSGDCDDITVLYAALLQSIGIDTALVDVGDHVLIMFDTGLKTGRYRLITSERALVYLDAAGRIWVPVETTLVGRTFNESWRAGAGEISKENKIIVAMAEAWRLFPPVSGGQDDAASAGSENGYVDAVAEDLGGIEDALLQEDGSSLRRLASREPENAAVRNRLGILLGRRGYFNLAGRFFEEVIRLQPAWSGGYVNLANIHYEKGEYPRAVELYNKALALDPGNSQVHVEIALTYAEMGDFVKARRHYMEALEIDPRLGDLRGSRR